MRTYPCARGIALQINRTSDYPGISIHGSHSVLSFGKMSVISFGFQKTRGYPVRDLQLDLPALPKLRLDFVVLIISIRDMGRDETAHNLWGKKTEEGWERRTHTEMCKIFNEITSAVVKCRRLQWLGHRNEWMEEEL